MKSDPRTVLAAVARFLETEVRPAVADPALAYRVLVAAGMLEGAARELATADAREVAELSWLKDLFPGAAYDAGPASTPAARREQLDVLRRMLVEQLRSVTGLPHDEDELVRAHLRRTLKDTLAATNPRFDTSDRIEPPWTSLSPKS